MPANKSIRFSWDIHWDCNYRCPYCWWHGRWESLKGRNRYPGLSVLIDTWKRIHEKYGEVHIEINGGEPTLYPDFMEFLKDVLKYHTVGIMTNLSGDVSSFVAASTPGLRKRLKIGASFHPLFSDFDGFAKKAVALKDAGVSVGVLYLAYPPQVPDIPRYQKLFADLGIFFAVSTFWGTYNDREYPGSYTDEERRTIETALGKREGQDFQTKPLVTRGKLCNAGHTYGIIHPDGEVLRCGGGSVKEKNVIMGNIFDKDFTLFDGPRPCTSDNCPCNEWAFLLNEAQ